MIAPRSVAILTPRRVAKSAAQMTSKSFNRPEHTTRARNFCLCRRDGRRSERFKPPEKYLSFAARFR